ncbi:hypothetical protein MUK42_13909 [Musa troglodytarum]|uniref:Uncharacterized protein n=1 Tax=Musa troglodytarum TaxID=320322 RepID=A0A9E7I8K1_9LILI|nr:hypothetical protein MUK42_13909 [Musa troglodytarum]
MRAAELPFAGAPQLDQLRRLRYSNAGTQMANPTLFLTFTLLNSADAGLHVLSSRRSAPAWRSEGAGSADRTAIATASPPGITTTPE